MNHLLQACFISVLVFFSIHGKTQGLNTSMTQYWSGKSKAKLIKDIESKGYSLGDIKDALRKGRSYPSKVKKGFYLLNQNDKKLPPHALVFIPFNYDPGKKYPIRIFFHGAVSNLDPQSLFKSYVDTTSTAYKDMQSILIFPTAWLFAPWWNPIQFENVNRLLRLVKQNYNVDENRIRLLGISDGGTGCFYLSNCDVTPWSCITPFIGSLAVLNVLGPRQVYMSNFINKPYLIVNTGKDNIFPKKDQLPYLNLLTTINKNAFVIWVDSAGHSMRWLNVLRDSINSFADHHQREPYPKKIIWHTDNPGLYGRNHFLQINAIGKTKSNGDISDPNSIIDSSGKNKLAFKRDSIAGAIKIEREDNTFLFQSSGVKKFTLLLSSDFVDFQKPITVFVNEKKSFEGIVKPDAKTLLKWNLKDDDRSMLFEAELSLKVN
ncbi:MAG TPA: hypothetical protein VGQ59_18905 [Cyclobacteriaceae bacterium]|jgi:hypothetical protein|nr:hypothetical protein [Cyclobacteriaceae bacterium]